MPVARRTPRTTSTAPATRWTRGATRRSHAARPGHDASPREASTNGTPIPRAYDTSSRAPRPAWPDRAATTRAAPSRGPTHGVHAAPKAQLPKNYTIFGKVTDGMDILDKIAKTPVKASAGGEPSVPTQDVHINSVTIEEK